MLSMTTFYKINAQTHFREDCYNDFGGVLTSGNPDVLVLPVLSEPVEVLSISRCLSPSSGDYNDFFRIYVPSGYDFTALQYGYLDDPSPWNTEMRLDIWYGDEAQPVGSPDIIGGPFAGGNSHHDDLLANVIEPVGFLPGGSWYSIRVDMVNWPSARRYFLYFTFTCNDNTPPIFTTPAGGLDATVSCDNAAAIAAALAAEPSGTDDSGSVTLTLIDDETIPSPGCLNTYTRIRSWRLEDDCGNQSSTFTQTITTTDNTAPTITSVAGSLDVTIPCDNPFALAAALAQVPTGTDNCGSAIPVMQSDISFPDPHCPNAYVRSRSWRFEDECGNLSATQFHQTIVVQDNELPVFTTPQGAMDATLECSDIAGIAAALAIQPSATDNCGSVELELFWDIITPDPDCPNAYTHERVWRLFDECGNQSAVNYGQTITVYDNTAPVVFALDGPVAIADVNGYIFGKEDIIDINTSFDNCSEELTIVSIIPSMVTCDQLGMFIPVEITVADDCGNQTVVVAIKEVTEDLSIKPPFNQSDIGATANGDALHYPCDEEFHVFSSGFSNLQNDVAHFVYAEICGDGEIIARLNQVQPAGVWGGLMVRENLTQGSRKMALESSLSNMVRRDIRSSVNGNSMITNWPIMPGMVWLRINRTGNMFNLYTSHDGNNWQFRGASQLVLQECVLFGIYAESINNMTEATAIFDEVTISGGVVAKPGISNFSDVVSNVENEKLDISAVAFPNPASNDLFINLNEMSDMPVGAEILDLNGRSLKYQSFSEGLQQIHLDVSSLGQGMYICLLQSKCGQTEVLKFIKE